MAVLPPSDLIPAAPRAGASHRRLSSLERSGSDAFASHLRTATTHTASSPAASAPALGSTHASTNASPRTSASEDRSASPASRDSARAGDRPASSRGAARAAARAARGSRAPARATVGRQRDEDDARGGADPSRAADTAATDAERTADPTGGASPNGGTPAVAGPGTLTPETVGAGVPSTAAIDRSLAHLDPDFRGRLERVIDRLEQECGVRVRVVETLRSQGRQDELFAQGRTTDGPVVTWTRNSRHRVGQAADLEVVGDTATADAYAALARIAEEEGLHTLGLKDPGHVQLGIGAPSMRAAQTLADAGRRVTPPGQEAAGTHVPAPGTASASGVASVAAVASVAPLPRTAAAATIASVATVAAVPVPGASAERTAAAGGHARLGRVAGSTIASANAGAGNPSGLAALAQARGRQGGDAAAHGEDRNSAGDGSGTAGSADATIAHSVDELIRGAVARFAAHQPVGHPPAAATGAALEVIPSRAELQAERVLAHEALRDQQAAQPASSVVIALDRPDGQEDRVRVALRGDTVAATLDIADSSLARHAGQRLSELERVLARQGVDAALQVRTGNGTDSSADSRDASRDGQQRHPRDPMDRGARDGSSDERRRAPFRREEELA